MKSENEIKANYLTVKGAAQLLNLDTSRISALIKADRLPGAFKMSDIWLIPRESVLHYTRKKPGPKKRDKISSREILENALKEMNEGR